MCAYWPFYSCNIILKEKVRIDSMIRLVKETDAEAIINIRKEIILSETTTKFS